MFETKKNIKYAAHIEYSNLWRSKDDGSGHPENQSANVIFPLPGMPYKSSLHRLLKQLRFSQSVSPFLNKGIVVVQTVEIMRSFLYTSNQKMASVHQNRMWAGLHSFKDYQKASWINTRAAELCFGVSPTGPNYFLWLPYNALTPIPFQMRNTSTSPLAPFYLALLIVPQCFSTSCSLLLVCCRFWFWAE